MSNSLNPSSFIPPFCWGHKDVLHCQDKLPTEEQRGGNEYLFLAIAQRQTQIGMGGALPKPRLHLQIGNELGMTDVREYVSVRDIDISPDSKACNIFVCLVI